MVTTFSIDESHALAQEFAFVSTESLEQAQEFELRFAATLWFEGP